MSERANGRGASTSSSLTVGVIFLYLTAYTQMIPSSSLSGTQVRLFNYNPLTLFSGNYKGA